MEKIRVTQEEFDEMLREQEELAEEMKDEIPIGETFTRSFEEAYGMYEILGEKNFYLNEEEGDVVKKCFNYLRAKEGFNN